MMHKRNNRHPVGQLDEAVCQAVSGLAAGFFEMLSR
jgi:hypothetical protein